MKKILFFAILLTLGKLNFAQRLLSWTPEFPQDNSTMVITVDCAKGNQGLFNYANPADVYVHLGVNTNLSTGPGDWKYVKFPNFNAPNAAAQATSLGNNKYSYTITNIRSFFAVPVGETINKVNVIFRSGNGSLKNVNSDGSDMYIPVYAAGQYAVRLNLPPFEPRFTPFPENITATVGSTINIAGVASNGSALTIKLNGTTVNTASAATAITASPTITANCEQKIMLEGNDGTGLKKDSFSFFIPPASNVAALPAGAVEGINYLPGNTSATLVLFAPNKTTVNLIGEFGSWTANCSNLMNKTPDGNYYWLTVTGLVPGQEYAYQYLVDNTIKTADPYTQKVLDANNDPFITAVTYPNLKPYPTGFTTGLVGVLQTAEPAYPWQVTNFAKPDKRNLVIYELLIRDFIAEHSYQALIDSIQYLKGIGINAIELMPVNEFDNNESWGYNPSFYFAPDKYYGTKNKLKEFIDVCHQNGIAVIMDVVYNHCTGEAPQAKMYWNSTTNQPTLGNPWLNVSAPHPYSVFNDFNHTLATTRYLFQRNLKFWLDEYKVDGFRFDLAKGFTQTVTNTTTVENYDASRVANLKYYYDQVIPTYPNTYMILEFLGSTPSQEEQEYVSHGFMMWGNINFRWSQNTMGFAANSDLSANVYNSSQRNFSNPAGLIGYMQSHDEERTMYRNLQFGNSNGGYDVKQLNTALEREEAAAAIFFTIPGPKMIWQFEERGYDISINFGGSNLANKPPLWNYMTNPNRRKLYNLYKKVLDLRLGNQAIFNNTTFNYNLFDGGGLVRSINIDEPVANGKRVVTVANFDVVPQTRTFTFQGTGTWTNYVSNGTGTGLNGATNSTFNITNISQSITLAPGEYHIYFYTPPCNVIAPTVVTPLTYCQNTTAPALTATGTGLLWYTSSTGGTGSPIAPVPSTTAAGITTYYVSQTVGPCESPRASIIVNITAATIAPTVVTPINYCQNATATALTATGTNLLWYTAASGGTGSATAPTPLTTTVGNTTYYVSQTGTCGEGPRAAIVVNVIATPSAPSVTSPISYCQNATATPLTATGTNLLWYTVASGGTGSSTAITPSTTASGSTTYYVSQTVNGCEGLRAAIVVNVTATPAAPTVTTLISYCQNTTATPLTATGTNLLWYLTSTGGTGSATAPTPSTTTIGSTTYYVSQTINSCEGPRAAIVVNITASTPAPTVTTPITYCQAATASPLTATGTNLLWYANASGGTGSATAPIPSTANSGSTTYYVSQTTTCGEGPRAAIVVNVNATPSAPGVTSPIVYCQFATATALTATGSNLLWYTVPAGGTGSTTTPTPSTTTAGTQNFYVSQTVNNCESPRVQITVTIVAVPNAPTVTSPVTYCQNVAATALTAIGTNLKWYTTAVGGVSLPSAPIPSTTTIGNTIYYVSQTINGCEGPRAAITVNVIASTPSPIVTSPVNYCQNATATALTATGTSLLWYILPTGGTGSSAAPTPSTTTLGSTTYYVSQTLSCGEGPRAAIVVNVNPIPTVPTIVSSAPTCTAPGSSSISNYNAANTYVFTPAGPTVNATGAISGMVFFTSYIVAASQNSCSSASSATFSNSAQLTTPAVPTINSVPATCSAAGTSTISNYNAGNTYLFNPTSPTVGAGGVITGMIIGTNYTVSASSGICTSANSASFNNAAIIPTPGAPVVSNPAAYCQGSTATALTATGTNLLWYTTQTGGTGSATAPVPSTTNAGTQTFYVSQTVNTCEGPRATITVTVNPTPAAPTAASPINYCQNATATALSATGNNLLWYTVPTGGTSSSTAPTPSTSTAGNTSFYVSQTINGCASPRATIVVNVTALPAAPIVTSPITYCQNATAVALTANGTGLLWFANATGGTGSATAPTPSTAAAGSTNYYVAQSNSCGEGARATIVVNVNATPAAPTNLNVTNVSLTSATLNWTGTANSFYTVEYKLANATAYTVAATGVQTTSAIINNLVQGGSYQFRVSANCEATGLGSSSAVFNFSTQSRNNTITTINNGLGLKISPNPISQTGIVDYLIPENGNAKLEILDRNGKTVLIIALGNQTPGQYFKNINGQLSQLASGTFYMRLVQNSNSVGMSFVKYP
jgi:1,4-alpha-glucan branching enzyme